jgi:hypothetical protein
VTTDILPELRSLLAAQPLGSGAHDTLTRAIADLVHLRWHRDDLQTCNTRVVEENRVLRAQLASLQPSSAAEGTADHVHS